MNGISENKKILIVGQACIGSSGGNQVRSRNYEFLTEYFGKENTRLLTGIHDISGSKSIREFGLIKVILKYGYDCYFLTKLIWLLITIDKYATVYFDQSNFLFMRFISLFAGSKKKIVFFHNIESSYLNQNYKDKSAYYKKYIQRVFQNEQWIVNNADMCIAINKRDSDLMKCLYGKDADFILPVSFKDSFVAVDPEKTQGYMLFVGSDFYGNTDGLFWFIENCMEKIDKKLFVVGSGMEKYKTKYSSDKIEFSGFVEDLSAIYEKADFVILPIISGGGMKVKTAEALMYGKKIIGTKEAFEGYSCVDGENCMECNTVNEFVECIGNFYEVSGAIFSERNRRFFLDNYENDVAKKHYFDFLDNKI